MPMDGNDQDLLQRQFDSLEGKINDSQQETSALLLAILNHLRHKNGELPLTVAEVVAKA